jgi:Tol biopolymer transport system component
LGGIEIPVFSLSAGGTLAYVRHEAWTDSATLVWVNREGNVTPVEGQPLPANSNNFSLSADRRRLTFMTGGSFDIWTYDLEDGISNKITTFPGFDGLPIWADDDERIVFSSGRSGINSLWWKSADGMGEAEELLPAGPEERPRFPVSWSSRGIVAYTEMPEAAAFDIGFLWVEGDRSPRPFATNPKVEDFGQFSPDGDLFAYESNETDTFHVYIEPVPQTGDRIRVSRGGGYGPFWSADGRQLFFAEPGGRGSGTLLEPACGAQVLVSEITTGPQLEASAPEPFFECPEDVTGIWPFETARGFLGIERKPPPRIRQVEVVLNFFDLLERLAPNGR